MEEPRRLKDERYATSIFLRWPSWALPTRTVRSMLAGAPGHEEHKPGEHHAGGFK